ncbi:MAG TPA: glycosyltransferase family 4 protein [Anaerolineales bacterium]|nr:glycosyltransferase family 4 protein [Anaerolineales bacterium]
MKILVINSEYPPVGGGAGNASAHIARLLAGMGNEVLVLTSHYGSLPREEQCGNLRILRGPTWRRHADRSSAPEQIMFMLGAMLRSLGLLRSFAPAMTLAFFGLPSGAVAWLVKAVAGVPYVVSLRGGDVPGFRPYDFWLYHKLAMPWLHLIWRNAAAVVANSQGLFDLARAFDSRVPIAIVPNGVDPKEFRDGSRQWSPPRLLSVGRVVYQKGYDVAMSALAGLKDLPWEWTIVGDGPFLGALQRMVEQNALDGRVRFSGWEPAERVKQEYASANLFLHPSRHEGMPNAVLEAMASGLPVIATRIAGNEELVSDPETGLLVPVNDAQSLQDSLRELLVDGARREQMGHAGRMRVEESFGWESVARQYQTILNKAV